MARRKRGAAWVATVYPTAGEGSIVRCGDQVKPPSRRDGGEASGASERAEVAHVLRARARVRRYCRANHLRYLWTLTFADSVRTLPAAGAAWDRFAARLREKFGRLPLVAVFEPHPGGHGYHVHFGAGRFLSIERVRELWALGRVHVGDRQKGMAGRVPTRQLAAYLAKYLGKTTGEDAAEQVGQGVSGRRPGEHRYRVAQGFAPASVVRGFAEEAPAYRWLVGAYGEPSRSGPLSFRFEGAPDGWWFEWAGPGPAD